MKLEATHLRDRRWAVRPEGVCGTCGWINNAAWQVRYVTASSTEEAIHKVEKKEF